MAKAGTPRRRWGGRDVALVAVFAALTCVLGLIPPLYLPISPAPITAQTLGVMLAGAVLGGKRAAAAMALVVALVAAGLPVLSGGRGGLAVFAGPTVGFLVGWIPAAALTGWLTARFGAPNTLPKGLAANAAGGIVALY
ncbi:MAG: biotin transporter BioY, partial [Bifidobacteriaceae bacterium]|nr:biotin transporter BioY [Bifidobacteriaceae bacterium]